VEDLHSVFPAYMSTEPTEILERSLRFAREELGPFSERLISTPEAQALLLSRVRGELPVEDAVLKEVHRASKSSSQAADEFLGYFLEDAHRRGRRLLSDDMRRFLETGDLVQSVFGEVWSSIADLHFETRAQFFALLGQRLRWKAIDKARRLNAERRKEVGRHPLSIDDIPIPAEEKPPSSHLGRHEETQQMVLRLLKLSERDQLLVRMHLRGASYQNMAEATGIAPEAARKALTRAIERIQSKTRDPKSGDSTTAS